MQGFIQAHSGSVTGVLSGFDRMRFRGTLRMIAHVSGLSCLLSYLGILLKDFKGYALGVSEQLKTASLEAALAVGRPVKYLPDPSVRKEDVARQIAQADGLQRGLICVLTAVEPCRSFDIRRDRQSRKLVLISSPRKCLHLYHYYLHEQLGFMHARLQTWLPFNLFVCLNGREWLARQMDAARMGYVRRDNCFTHLEDMAAAQALFDEQLRTGWSALLDGIARQVNPAQEAIFARRPLDYYWSLEESEWATDVMFRSHAELAALYPRLIRYGMEGLESRDVLRFLGRPVPASGGINGNFAGEVVSDLKDRPEGLRIKHRVNRNSVKMYDKQGSVLRVETTINDPRDLKVWRQKEGQKKGPAQWRRMRKGVADVHRRAEVSQAANGRYLEAMAAVEGTRVLGELAQAVCRPVRWNGQRVRGLNPLGAEDAKLLGAVSRGEFVLNGFRNRDLQGLLYESPARDKREKRRRSGAVTRKLRLLRAHGLVRKVPRTHRYQLSHKGRELVTALLAARAADVRKLTEAA